MAVEVHTAAIVSEGLGLSIVSEGLGLSTVEVRVVPMSGHEFLSLGLMATICCYHGYHLPYSPINGYTGQWLTIYINITLTEK